MRQIFLALMLLVVITIGVNSGKDSVGRKPKPKCSKPNGKLGKVVSNGCSTNVCKKSGGGGAAWETCPIPASAETLQEEMKSLRTLVQENQDEIQNNNKLLMELLKLIGPVSTNMVPTTTSSSWLNVVFELKEEFTITKDFLVGTLPFMGKSYKIKFDWFITQYGSGWQDIIQFAATDGGFGVRIPGVWIHDNNIIHPCAPIVSGSYSCKDIPFAESTGKWMTMEISQYMVADNKFEFDFKVDGTSYWTVANPRPSSFSGVKMYAGNPWHTALDGKIRNFQVLTRND